MEATVSETQAMDDRQTVEEPFVVIEDDWVAVKTRSRKMFKAVEEQRSVLGIEPAEYPTGGWGDLDGCLPARCQQTVALWYVAEKVIRSAEAAQRRARKRASRKVPTERTTPRKRRRRAA